MPGGVDGVIVVALAAECERAERDQFAAPEQTIIPTPVNFTESKRLF